MPTTYRLNAKQMEQNNPALKSDLFGQQIVLTKQCSEEQIKRYFTAVLKLSKSGDEFPVSLDEVWMLVYGQKSDAVSALKGNFIQDVDYQVLRKNPQNPKGGRPTDVYKLSVPCMEFFIARKVRVVFDVYRIVFHKVANSLTPSYQIEDPIKRAEAWIEEQKARMALERKNAEAEKLIAAQAPKVEYYDQVLQSEGTMTTRQLAMSIGMTANTLNKKLCDAGIQFRQSGMYILHAPYSSYNLTSVRSYPYTASDGRTLTKQYLVWNERGKQFVTMLHRNNFDAKKTRQEISPEFWLKMLRPQCLPSTDN